MRELNIKEITAAVAKLCCDACYYLPQDLLEKFESLPRYGRIAVRQGGFGNHY